MIGSYVRGGPPVGDVAPDAIDDTVHHDGLGLDVDRGYEPPDDALDDPDHDLHLDERLPPPGPDEDSDRGAWWSRPTVVLPLAVAVLAATLLSVLVSRRGERPPGVGEAIVTVSGAAGVRRSDGTVATVRDGRVRLGPGDRLDVRRGSATFELAERVFYEGVAHAGRVAGTSVQMAAVPELRSGTLLVRAPVRAPVRAGAAQADVAAGGVARLTRTYALRTGVYRGSAMVSSAGATGTVPALRAADVVGPGDLSQPRPLALDAADRWDQRYLGDALDLARQLGPLRRSMRSSGVDPVTFLAAVGRQLPGSPAQSRLARLAGRRANGLDGGIALAVVGYGTGRSLEGRWAGGQRFHDAGATWGLVAMDLGADPDAVTAALRAALDQRDVVGSARSDGRRRPGNQEPTRRAGTTPAATATPDGSAAPSASTAPGGAAGSVRPGGSSTPGGPSSPAGAGTGTAVPPATSPGGGASRGSSTGVAAGSTSASPAPQPVVGAAPGAAPAPAATAPGSSGTTPASPATPVPAPVPPPGAPAPGATGATVPGAPTAPAPTVTVPRLPTTTATVPNLSTVTVPKLSTVPTVTVPTVTVPTVTVPTVPKLSTVPTVTVPTVTVPTVTTVTVPTVTVPTVTVPTVTVTVTVPRLPTVTVPLLPTTTVAPLLPRVSATTVTVAGTGGGLVGPVLGG